MNKLMKLIIGKITEKNIYPVGSVYMQVDDKEPNVLFGGTWKYIADYTWKRIA